MWFVHPVYATCPACVVTIGGGLLIAKKLGMDDLLVSIWLSGFNTAFAFLIVSGAKSRKIFYSVLLSLIFLVLNLLYLFFSGQLFHAGNTLWGIDKIILGTVVGFIGFLFSVYLDRLVRKTNKGKVLFRYQKVLIPVFLLFIITLLFNIGIGH